ncbi:MAG: hypothetical protein IKU06_04020 [Lachnospiraceae bacterium]|nr:hypothetical protein [Lachnospiraceae bacterium]
MKKTKLALLLCILVIVFCACSKNEEGEQEKTGSTPTEAVTPTESVTPTLEVTPTAEITPSAEPTGEVTPTPTEEPTPTEDPAVTDINTLMAGTEQIGVTDKVLLNDVLVTYYDYLTEYMNDSEYADFDRTRYGLAFIDGDQIPELLIADNDNHGTGVRVIFYNNGEPVEVGQFGSEGGFSYIKYENRIISFYMGYGAYTTDIYHIEQDFSSKADYEFYDSDEEACTVNGEETEYTRYEELLDEARESKLGNKRLLVDYETLMRYYPYSNEELVTFSLIRMFQELREAEFESFPVYFNDDLRKIEDNWSLIESKAETADASFKYDVVKDNGNKEGYKTYSEVIISEYSGVGIWLSAYKNDDSLDALNITEYNMPMVYCESEEDDAKYRWYAKAFPEDEQFNWEMKLYYDENSDHLIIKLDRPESEDAVTLTYERHWEEYEVHSLEVELTRREDYDSTRGKAFEAKEYLIVSADDAELIKEYGLPEDLDGYDYEIVYPDKDTFIIYVDEYTDISIVSFEDGFHMEPVSPEEFCDREYFGTYEVSFEDYNPDGDYNGMMAVSVTEKYTG